MTKIIEIIVGVIVGACLIGVGYLQYSVYKRQAGIMKKQTEIAAKQNSLTESIQRAFITVRDPEMIAIRDDKGIATNWQIKIIMKNSGTTPRKNLNYITSAGAGSDRSIAAITAAVISSDIFNPELAFDRGHHIKTIIGPQDTQDVIGGVIPISDLADLKSGEVFQLFSGTIHYGDIFTPKPHHLTEFCFFIIVNRDRGGNVVPTSIHCERWNCADDECANEDRERADNAK